MTAGCQLKRTGYSEPLRRNFYYSVLEKEDQFLEDLEFSLVSNMVIWLVFMSTCHKVGSSGKMEL